MSSMHWVALTALTGFVSSVAHAEEERALTASGPWQIGQKTGVCRASRSFSDAKQSYVLVLAPDMTGRGYSVGYVDPDASFAGGKVELELAVGGGFKFMDKGWAAPSLYELGVELSLKVPQAAVATVANAAEISISGRGKTARFAAPDLTPATTALQQCKERQLRSWGINPATVAQIEASPKPKEDASRYFNFQAYPPEAVRRGEQGRVAALLSVSDVGVVTDCRILESSGSRALDQTTCAVSRARVRYDPARSRSGEAVAGLDVVMVTWVMSGVRR